MNTAVVRMADSAVVISYWKTVVVRMNVVHLPHEQ